MKSVNFKIIPALFLILSALLINSCKTLNESSEGCVVSFIVAAENRNMNRAWDILSPQAQQYYNGLGEKMRKSGKGALENEIARIVKFRSVKQDYRIEVDPTNNMNINIVVSGGPTHIVATENIDGNYKIKNETSVRSLLEGISADTKKNEGY
jgi:hypothetical protein